jgi:hypothetical protein
MTDRPPALSAAEGPPEECANCGAAIPRKARACPHCGADERTGWRETSVYDGLNLPDSAYDDGPRPPRRQGLAWYWIVAIVAGIIVSLFFSLGGR